MNVELITKRLKLSEFGLKDRNEVFILRSNPEVIQFIKREPPTDQSEVDDFIKMVVEGMKNGENVNWSISLKGDPKMIGSICLWNFSTDRKLAEIGYDLLPQYQGKGYMSEAMKAVINYGFEKLSLNCIEAYTSHLNKSSLVLLNKNGFILNTNKKDEGDESNIILELKNKT